MKATGIFEGKKGRNMRKYVIAAIALLGLAAIVLAVVGSHGSAWALLLGAPFLIGYTHSSLSDQTDTALEFGSQLLTGAGGAQSGATIDTQGYDGVLFTINVGVITGAGALDAWAQSGANANASDQANIASGSITQVLAAKNNNVVQVDIYKPTNRYVRLQFNQTVNNVQVACVATRYRRSGLNPSANIGQATQSPSQVLRIVQN